MPNIEALCASGLVFENAYTAPVCSPTRATMITGQYGFRTGVGATVSQDGTNGLSADTTSLFDIVAGSGHSANLIGKWHLAGAGTGFDHPDQLGVADYYGLFRGETQDYSNWTAVENGSEIPVTEYATTAFTDRAIDWIGAQEQPWFLWLAYNAPYAPFHLPPEDLHSLDDLPADAASIAENPLPYYQAMLEALDTEIGRLLASMSQEERDNTIIIFMGDNGSPNQVTSDIYGIHDAKGTIYEGGTHVPFIVSGPGVTAGRTDATVNSTDIFATVAGLIGQNTDSPDSIDFSPVLSGGQGARDHVYVEHFSDEDPVGSDIFGWALREGNYKLVQEEGEAAELYDLSVDPQEENDLLASGGNNDDQQTAQRLADKANTLRASE